MLVTLYRLNDRISLQPRRGAARVQVKLADEVTLRNTVFQGIQVVRMGGAVSLASSAAARVGQDRCELIPCPWLLGQPVMLSLPFPYSRS